MKHINTTYYNTRNSRRRELVEFWAGLGAGAVCLVSLWAFLVVIG